MSPTFKWLRAGVVALFGMFVAGLVGTLGVYLYLAPQLPTLEDLRDVRLQVPLRVYSSDGGLIAEFGEMKRTPLRYAEVPPQVIQAVLAAEDDRFFQHPGVDYQGLARAAVHLLRTGEKAQGGSTITMQVARNFFLSSEKTYARKLKEIFVALTMEQELSKEEILELYLNKIYLGNRAYGIASAAQIYYGKKVEDLELAQIAMIAGLPKAPSLYNPIVNPTRAIQRRNYVLGRMQSLGFIDAETATQARLAPVTAALHAQSAEVDAAHLAEMVRAEVVARFGEGVAYTSGYKVYTTVDSRLQQAATQGVRAGLLDYDRRHGYRGPGARVELESDSALGEILARYPVVGGLVPGIVVELEEQAAHVAIGAEERVVVDWSGLEWARRYINDERVGDPPAKAADILTVGDVIRLEALPTGGWRLAQVPQVEGALVSLQPRDGAVLALVGGFDFFDSKFNRVTQAQRQPGSAFKPFVYSAALEKGFTTATVINDAPVVFEDAELESAWRPENYSGKFYGPTRLREALVASRNLVSIRLLRAIGIGYARNYLKNFGFDATRLPHDLSLALGSGAVTPMEMVRGYAVLANGGYLVEPYFIQRIEDADGNVLFEAAPPAACPQCEQPPVEELANNVPAEVVAAPAPPVAARTLDARNVYLMNSMLNDVVARGTGARARALGRHDLAGKTGTTNDQRDAWFCGFNADVVATAWLGFDTPRSLGGGETGAGAALPMWVDYMREALAGLPEHPLPQPAGVVTVRIDPETGLSAAPGKANAIFETFYSENVPSTADTGPSPANTTNQGSVTEQLF
ncbi:MAG: penicillin-binding protein 1A [Gammaproteobacteria bacterium]|nr:penicillin-binding protein 1A [Gammaproteobacteria bacterium]